MVITFSQLLIWLVVGALAGSLAGWLVRGRKRGYGFARNLILGLVGAIIGSILFDLLDITVAGDIVLTLTDLVAAFVGSLIVLGLMVVVQRRR